MSKKTEWESKLSVKFILCEDIRAEMQGKVSLVGVYPGENLLLVNDPPPGTPKDHKPAISSLAFVFFVSNGSGKASPRVIISDPRGKVAAPVQLADTTFVPDSAATIAGLAKPFVVGEVGKYSIRLEIGVRKFEFHFLIRKATTKELKNLALPNSVSGATAMVRSEKPRRRAV
jgi:hypothetical protein